METKTYPGIARRLAALACVCAILALNSCSSSDGDSPDSPSGEGEVARELVGRWLDCYRGFPITPITDGGLILNADGSGFWYEGDPSEIKWVYDRKTGILTIHFKGDDIHALLYKIHFYNADNFCVTDFKYAGADWEEWGNPYVREGKEVYWGEEPEEPGYQSEFTPRDGKRLFGKWDVVDFDGDFYDLRSDGTFTTEAGSGTWQYGSMEGKESVLLLQTKLPYTDDVYPTAMAVSFPGEDEMRFDYLLWRDDDSGMPKWFEVGMLLRRAK